MGTEDQGVNDAGRGRLRHGKYRKYRILFLVVLAVVVVVRLAVVPRLDGGASANVLVTLYLLAAVAAVGLSIRAVVESVRSDGTRARRQRQETGSDG